MIIACDVDDVVADLTPEWLRRYNRDFRTNLQPCDCTAWDWTSRVAPECGERIYQYLQDPDLYAAVEPVVGALPAITALKAEGHRVVWVTSAVGFGMEAKRQWLINRGFMEGHLLHSSPDYVVANDKALIRADLLIDDRPYNLEHFPGRTILYDRPWNHGAPGARLFTWADLPRALASSSQHAVWQ